MGVDWLPCACGETFPDCGDYVSCECGEVWCSEECAEKDGYRQDICKNGHDVLEGYEQNDECEQGHIEGCNECDKYIKGGCNYCRQEDFQDNVLLDHALEMLDITRQELVERYKETL